MGRIVSIMACMPEQLRELCMSTVPGGLPATAVAVGGPGRQGGGPCVHCSVPDRGVVRAQPRPPEHALQSRPHHQRSPVGAQPACALRIDSSDNKLWHLSSAFTMGMC